ncbi:NnrS family protein [Mesorhizobium sp. ZMM04-5]|uniref:NnrS family protein n=1 Tax=Mesorhizobium marinum TaxID=3228790 RepID=A0ABV3QW07_9HYPH
MAIPRTRPGNYPAFLSYGFRPFFLLGSIWGGLAVLAWLPILSGRLETASLFAPVDWHAHEMIFGFLPAIVTGFLLTAIPNWTGRLPVQGLPLALLAALWLAGRVVISLSAYTGWVVALAVDCAFLLVVVATAAREIVAGRNWRNLKVVVPVSALLAANLVFHLEAHLAGSADIGRRLGIAVGLVLIMIIGGRIIPSFTRNWLVRANPGRLPEPFGRFDAVAIVSSAAALGLWSIFPDSPLSAALLLVAGTLNLARLARWAGYRTFRDPLVLVLHAAYLFLPVGLIVAGLAVLYPETLPPASGIHVLGVGAIGSMTLGVMARATLGHTGRELRADAGTCVIFAAIALAAPVRFAAVLLPDVPALLHVSAALWVAAFFGFAALYGGALMLPRAGAMRTNGSRAAAR